MTEGNKELVAKGVNTAVGFGQIGLGIMASEAERRAGAAQKAIAEFNARQLELQAQRVKEIGARESNQHREKVNQLVGSQRAGYAAGNIDVNSGSAAEVQEVTANMGASDARMIENNAYLEAMGLKYKALDVRNQGALAQISANSRGDQSLVTMGLQGALTINKYNSKQEKAESK